MTTTATDWNAFKSSNAIGDPGRQPDIRSATGDLNVGVPDTALDFLTANPFEIRACSSRGWSHRYRGTPRQDSYSVLVNDDAIVVAVADGVSEGEFSQVAAETAARSACKLAADQLAKSGAMNWVQLGRRISLRVIEEAEYRQISAVNNPKPSIDERLDACLAKMSTTLIVAVILRTPNAAGFAAEICVVAGDSAAYLVRDAVLTPLGGGKDGSEPIASTGVRPIPGPVTPELSRHWLLPGDALVLGTDGIGDPLGDGSGEVGQAYADRWSTPPTIDQFLLDVNVYRRSYDDDRTAVGLWIRPDAVLPEAPADPPAEATDDVLPPGPPTERDEAKDQTDSAASATPADSAAVTDEGLNSTKTDQSRVPPDQTNEGC